MVSKLPAHVGAAIREAQPTTHDEIIEDLLVERAEVVVDRVHLDDADTAPREQLVEDVEGRDGSYVARAEDERDPRGLVAAAAVHLGGILACLRGADPRLNPGLCLVAVE